MTKPNKSKIIEALIKECRVDASHVLPNNITVFDQLNENSITHLEKLLILANAL